MKQGIVLGGLLGVALLATYITWFEDGEVTVKEGEAVVYSADRADISKVVWTSEKVDVELRPSKDEKGEYVMVHVTERREKAKPKPLTPPEPADDGHGHDHGEEAPEKPEDSEQGEDATEEAPEEPPEIETTVTYFKGNEAAEELMQSLAPLVAMRELSLPADADATAFGFDEPSATLEVHRAAGAVSITVGGETYGSKDKYVQLDDKTFLVDDQTLRPLQYGKTRLLERNLQPLAEKEITKIDVSSNGRSAAFTQANADDRTKAFWADVGTPDTEHEVAGAWLGKAFKMRARTYVEPADLPELTQVFRMVVHSDEGSWTVDVSKAADDDKAYYAQSDFLRSTVELTASLASDAIADIDGLFDIEAEE